MFEIALYFLGVVVVAGLVLAFLQAIVKNLWLTFKWNVLRIPPRHPRQEGGDEDGRGNARRFGWKTTTRNSSFRDSLTQEDKGIYHDRVKQSMRSVIEVYIDSFTRRH